MQDMLRAGMAGIPFVGADICGFNNYATEELCARWAAAGAWQPFARNHHADGFQEFYTYAFLSLSYYFLLHYEHDKVDLLPGHSCPLAVIAYIAAKQSTR